MSRTYRRKSGHRWWRKKQYDYNFLRITLKETYISWWDGKERNIVLTFVETVNKGYDKELIARVERDNHTYSGLSSRYKWYVNKSDRSCRRAQLHKILKTENYDDAWYDDSYENTKQRDYLWVVW